MVLKDLIYLTNYPHSVTGLKTLVYRDCNHILFTAVFLQFFQLGHIQRLVYRRLTSSVRSSCWRFPILLGLLHF